MLTSSHGGAIVTGRREEYLGVVDFAAVTAQIQQTVARSGAGEDAAGGRPA